MTDLRTVLFVVAGGAVLALYLEVAFMIASRPRGVAWMPLRVIVLMASLSLGVAGSVAGTRWLALAHLNPIVLWLVALSLMTIRYVVGSLRRGPIVSDSVLGVIARKHWETLVKIDGAVALEEKKSMSRPQDSKQDPPTG